MISGNHVYIIPSREISSVKAECFFMSNKEGDCEQRTTSNMLLIRLTLRQAGAALNAQD